jgi:hypothetical protein
MAMSVIMAERRSITPKLAETPPWVSVRRPMAVKRKSLRFRGGSEVLKP